MADGTRELQRRLRLKFSTLFEENPNIERIYKMIRNRSASYEEAQAFAIEVGDILKEVIASEDYTGVNLYELAEDVISLLEQNNRLVDAVCEVIQGQMNESVNTGLDPIQPNVPQSRIDGIREQIVNAKSNEDVYKAASMAQNTAQALVDEWVKTNADFQVKSGMGAVIVRKWSGSYPSHDTKHTDYCKELAGVYEYSDGIADPMHRGKFWSIGTDKKVFQRHEGCRCTVSYYPQGTDKGTITALTKGERDTNKVLWNTGKVYSYSRKAQLRRRREQLGKAEARRILNEEWRGGYNGNAERHF